MTKTELSELLKQVGLPVGEGEQFLTSKGENKKIAYWEYSWKPVNASGGSYTHIVTYQVSFVSVRPRDPKLIELLMQLDKKGIRPDVQHEYVTNESPGYHHSYFAVDVEEKLWDSAV